MCALVLALASVLQIVAAFLALRLIAVTGRRTAWILIAACMLIMCFRRVVPLAQILAGDVSAHTHCSELLGLVVSMLLVVGLAMIRPYFVSLRRSEEAVHASEEKYRAVFETTGTAMLIIEEDTTISLANSECERLTGYSRDELVGLPWTKLVHPDDLPWMMEYHRQRRQDRRSTPIAYNFRFVASGGRPGMAHITVDLIPGTNKSAASLLDITEQKKAEAALRESEKRYREVVEGAADLIFTTDARGNYRWANRAALAASGYTLEEIRGLNYMDLVLPDYRRRMQIHYMRQFAAKDLANFYEFPFRGKSGNAIWFAQNASLITDGDRVTGFHFIARDITERKRAEDALHEERRLFMGGPTMVFKWRAAEGWPIEYVSPNVKNELGYEPADLLSGKIRYAKIIHPDDLARVAREVGEHSAASVPCFEQEYRVAHADGQYRWLYDFTTVVRDAAGAIVRYQGYVLDITERKRAEEALEQSHSLLGATLESTADGILVVDAQGKASSFNRKFLELWRIPQALADTRDDDRLLQFVLDQLEQPDAFLSKVRQLYDTPDASSWDELRFRDGRVFERLSQPQRLGDKVTGRVWSFRDVTDRRRAEDGLRESEERYRSLVETAPDGIGIVVDDRIAFINTAGAVMFGSIDPATFLGRSVMELVNPKDMDAFLGAYRQLWQKRDEVSLIETNLRRLDGSSVPVEAASTVFTYRGTPALHVIFRDVSERRRAEAQIIRSERRYHELYEHLRDGAASVDATGRIMEFNHVFCEMLGYDPDEMRTLKYTDVTPAKWHAMEERILRDQVDARGYSDIYEKEYIRKDGTTFPVEMRTYLIQDDNGARLGYWATVRDIAERKRAAEREADLQARLARAQRMESLGVLAGGVAHDLNNILGPVVGYPDLILPQLPEDHPTRPDILEMQAAAKRAGAIIQDLLTLARRGSYQTEPVSLNEAVEGYLASANLKELKTRHPAVLVETRLAATARPVLGSIPHLTQVLMNLVINAFEAMPHGGKVVITTTTRTLPQPLAGYEKIEEGEYTVLGVSDTGPGIEPRDIEHIFEPFFTRKKLGSSGSGLGLSVVYGVVKDLHGYVDLSTRLGRGTDFTLYFPVAAEMDLRRGESLGDYRGTETILVVDDIPSQLTLASRLLSSLGYGVITRNSGSAAVDFLRSTRVDLVVLDMILEAGCDGLDAYKAILQVCPGQRCIIASGFSENERVKRAQTLGAGAFVRKPYSLENLGRAVREELDRR